MMDDNKQLALRIDGALQAAGQEVTALRAELAATGRRLAELGSDPAMEHGPQALLREEVAQLQEEVHLLRQMKEMLSKDLEETHGTKSPEVLSATELKVQLAQKEQELARAKEALQAMKADRKRLKAEKTDLVSQMQQLYATLESREEQLRDFIRNYEQHRKESEDAVKALAKEKDLLEREKWELRRQAKEATDHASALRSQLDLKDNRMKELEAELAMAKQSLATLTKDVPKRHSLAMPGETVLNGNQEWVLQADLPLTAAIRQSQQTLYHSHPQHSADRQAVRVSPCHSRQPSIISDASAAEGDRSSTPSDINSPRHRTHSLCNVSPGGQQVGGVPAGSPCCVRAVSMPSVPFCCRGTAPDRYRRTCTTPLYSLWKTWRTKNGKRRRRKWASAPSRGCSPGASSASPSTPGSSTARPLTTTSRRMRTGDPEHRCASPPTLRVHPPAVVL
uniref:Kazrin, periplakin interacting protein n=1 Tax=Anas zonorhyncha TaxID=75864 RepID=A0A8B9USY6_9AVES